MALAAAVLLVAGTSQRAAVAPRVSAAGIPSAAPPDTDWDDLLVPAPKATYGSFAAAARRARELLTAALGNWADSARWSAAGTAFQYRDRLRFDHGADGRQYPTFTDRDSLSHVSGVELALETHSEHGPDPVTVQSAFLEAGWVANDYYSADGPDGTILALECREALVHLVAHWDGGDDSDSTYVPEPGIRMEISIVPRPPLDSRVPPRRRPAAR